MIRKSTNWWKESDNKDVSEGVFAAVHELKKQPSVRDDYWLYSVLYGVGQSSIALSNSSATRPSAELQLKDGRLKYNVIRPLIDALMARIATQRTNVRFVTQGGKFSQRQKAKLLTKFVFGSFHRAGVYPILQQVFLDACVFGTGWIKPFFGEKDIMVERVSPTDVYVANIGTCKPYAYYQTKLVNLDELIEEYSDVPGVSNSQVDNELTPVGNKDATKCATVCEAWYTGHGKRRHVISTKTAVLVDEPWESDYSSLCCFRWKDPVDGFLGECCVAELMDIQVEINFILRRVQEQMNLGCYKIIVDQASEINTKKFNNQQNAIIRMNAAGRPPILFQIPPVDKQYFYQLDRLEEKARALIGLSELFMESSKPADLESGKALREYDDIQSKRFLHIGQRWQQFCIDIADRMIDLAKSEPGYETYCDDGDELKKIKWSDIDLDKSSYVMKAYPTSLLPETPAGQMQAVMEYIQFDPAMASTAIEYMEFPDVKAMLKSKIAPYLIVDKIIENILLKKEFIAPDPMMDLAYSIKQVQSAYLQAIMDEEDDAVLEALSKWVTMAIDLQQEFAPPMAGMPQELSGGPGGGLGIPSGVGEPPGALGMPGSVPQSPVPLSSQPM